MKFIRRTLLVLAASALLAGCGDDTTAPPDGVPYQLGFVTIQAPASVAPGDTIPVVLELEFPDTCHLYDHRRVERLPHRADITLWGRVFDGPCPATTYTDTVRAAIPDVAAGPFRVVVHFADGDSVVGEVAVP